MGGGKSSTSTSTTTIPPEVLARYNSVNAQAQAAAATPFQQYSTDPSAFVAQLNPTQTAGIAGTNAAANEAQPAYNAAAGMTAAGSGAANLGALNTNQYLSPYLNTVVQNTANQLQNQNQQQSSALQGSAIQAGAFGGDRAGIAQGNLANQQSLANAQTISGLLNTGYQQAQGVAQQQQGADLAAQQANLARLQAGGAQIANIGNQAQTSALQGASAQLTAGQAQQQTQQAGLTALYNQFLQQQSYPFQVSQFLANIAEGTGALSGSTTSTTSPSSFFSDKRLKEDIEPIGKTFDGQNIYRFRYKDKPGVQMGLIAQDVARKHPKAVGLAGGYHTVDYDEATQDAAKRGHFRAGGLVPHYAGGGSAGIDTTDDNPYGGAQLFDIQPLVLRRLLQGQPVRPQQQPQNDIAQFTGLANDAKSLYGDADSIYNGLMGKKAGGRISRDAGGGLYSQQVGGAPNGENTPDYSAMTSVPLVVNPTEGGKPVNTKPGANDNSDPNNPNNGKGVSTAAQTPAAPAISGIDAATHGGMGNAANLKHGGRTGYDDGGALPYDDQDATDVTTPQYLKQKTGINTSGLNIPDQQNTHGLMTSQNPTGAPTSGIGGLAGAVNTAKDIYGLGKGIAGLVAPATAATTAAEGLAPAIGAGAAAGAAGAGTAATAGGGILSGLLGLLPFLSTGGYVDGRKHFDDGGDVGDQDASSLPALSVDDLKDIDAAETARRIAALGSGNIAVAPSAGLAGPATAPAVVAPAANTNALPGREWLAGSSPDTSAPTNNPMAPFAHIGEAGYQQPGDANPGTPAVAVPPAAVAATDTSTPTGIVPRGAHAIAADVLSSFGAPATPATNDNSSAGLVPDLPPAQYIQPQRVRPIKAEMAAAPAAGDNAPTGIVPRISTPATVPASNVPNPGNRLVTPQEAQVAQGPSGGGGSVKEAILAHIAAGEAKTYNTLVGGGTFNGYSQFPKWGGVQGPEGVSHAAGLYQFQPGTFQAEAKKLGLPDFSPASQDAAAWDLAQTTYKQNTGRDLTADAQKGNVQWNALGSQWSSLRGAKAGPMGSASLPGSGGTEEHLGNGSDSTSSIGGGNGPSGGLAGDSNSGSSWWSDPSNQRLALSVLAGLGTMAGSNSRYLGSAILQGLGGGAQAYMNFGKGQADIGQTQARTVTEQQQANLTAAAAAQTRAETAKTGVETAATRYEKTYLPTGIMIRDVTKPNEPPKVIQYGQLDPTTGQTAVKPAEGTVPIGGDGAVPAASPAISANVNEQGLPAPQVPAQIPMNYLQMPGGGQEIARKQGEDALTTARTQSVAAQATNQQLADMSHSLSQLPSTGMLAAGSGFGSRLELAKSVNTATQAMGMGSPFDETAIANGEDLNKQTTRLGFALSRSLGSQEAAGITERAIGSVPGGANSPVGAQRIISSLKAANQRQIDYYNYVQQWTAKTGGDVTGLDAAFNKAAPPELYALSAFVPAAAMADLRAHPDKAKEFDKYYGGNYSKFVLGQ